MDAPLSPSSIGSEGQRQLFLPANSSVFTALPLSFGSLYLKIFASDALRGD